MASWVDYIPELHKKILAQRFGPNDSQIVSAMVHPVEAINRGGEWLRHNVSVAGGGDPYDNPNPIIGPTAQEQGEAGFNLAGLAQVGSMPGAPMSKGGTLGSTIKAYRGVEPGQPFSRNDFTFHSPSKHDASVYSRGGDVYETTLDIKKPYLSEEGITGLTQEKINELISKGYDGAGLLDWDKEAFPPVKNVREWVTFNPQQIISKRNINSLPETEYSKAHALAQKHAALPVEKGGLGLPPDNTAKDRAKAMGFDTEAYHGTEADIKEFKDMPLSQFGIHSGTKDTANTRILGDRQGKNIVPLFIKKGNQVTITDPGDFNSPVNMLDSLPDNLKGKWQEKINKLVEYEKNHTYEQTDDEIKKQLGNLFKENNTQSLKYVNTREFGGHSNVSLEPKNIRSRFAAFDPFNKDSANILASVLAGTALASGIEKDDKKIINSMSGRSKKHVNKK